MSENLLKLSGDESYHEILIAKAAHITDPESAEASEKALEAVKTERNLPQDSKDKKLGSEGPALKKFGAKLDEFLKTCRADESRAREALNAMISRATVRNKLAALINPEEGSDAS
ncbi:MAG: hypothetical protein P1V97_01125 [Planctomycetota bacterium]|nr:hypothetical protein [Planctomycetota bacterium]